MRCLCLASYHSLPTLHILCCVLCCVYAYAKLCVCGGGAHMPVHASSLVVVMSVCVMDPPPTFGDL